MSFGTSYWGGHDRFFKYLTSVICIDTQTRQIVNWAHLAVPFHIRKTFTLAGNICLYKRKKKKRQVCPLNYGASYTRNRRWPNKL
jgi:hypothetical protein